MSSRIGSLIDLCREKLLPGESVRNRAVVGSVWLSAIRIVGRGLHLVKLAVLGRLLAPQDFGIMGIALLALATLEQFSKLGFDMALVQREEDDVDPYLDTMWIMKIVRGATLATLAYAGAPYIAAFFGEPSVTGIIRVIAVLPLLRGFYNPAIVYFQKDLAFHKQFAWDTTGNFVNFFASVGFALVSPTVWALVFGNLVEDFAKLVLSYRFVDFRPGASFDWAQARELFAYGKWVTGSAALMLLLNQGDDAFVGWMLGATALGYYQFAFRFGNAPATEISQIFSNALFPTFSKVQSDLDRLRSAFSTSLELITLVSFPAAVGMLVVAPVFVPVVLGDDWLPIVPVLQILAVWGLIRSLYPVFTNLFQALNRPDLKTKIDAGRLVLLVVTIYPATVALGTEGTALAVTVTAGTSILVAAYLSVGFVEWTFVKLLYRISYPALAAIFMGIMVHFLLVLDVVSETWFGLLSMILAGVVLYCLATVCLWFTTPYDPVDSISKVINSI